MGKAVLAVLVVALTAHFAYFAFDPNHSAPDTKKYVEPAENWLAGHGFSRAGRPDTDRTPGYPLVIAAFRAAGLSLRDLVIAQHLASALVAVALLLIARRMTGSLAIGLLAALVTAIDLPVIHHANLVLTETLFTSLLLLLFVAIWGIGERSGAAVWQSAAAGLLLGGMTLVRPLAMLFFIPLALYLAWTRRDVAMKIVPVFVICSVLFPAAWIYRNDRLTGVPKLSTNSATLLLYWHAAGALAIEDPGDFEEAFLRRQAELETIAGARSRAVFGVSDVRDVPYIQRTAVDMELGREILLRHPVAFGKLFLRGIAVNLLGGGTDALTRVTTLSRSAASRLLLVYTAIALVLAIIGQVRLLQTNRRLGVLILLTIAYFIVFTAGALSYSRFRVPIVPMYAITIASGITFLRRAIDRGLSSRVEQRIAAGRCATIQTE